ncbi:MAG TPA: zf-HC2 domain-containing protein [Acidimicrobiales bacterium]
MRCSRIREAVSARLDGERPGVPPARVEAHLATCADCRAWARAAASLPAILAEGVAPADRVRARTAPDPEVIAAPLAEASDAASRPGPPRRADRADWADRVEPAGAGRRPALVSLGELRLVLAALAVVQLVIAWPGVLPGGHATAHMSHELTSWDFGLAVGLLFLAWQPSRAWGALPLVALLVTGLTATSVLDLLSGHSLMGREFVHLLGLAGLGVLWELARRVPRPSVVVRLA